MIRSVQVTVIGELKQRDSPQKQRDEPLPDTHASLYSCARSFWKHSGVNKSTRGWCPSLVIKMPQHVIFEVLAFERVMKYLPGLAG